MLRIDCSGPRANTTLPEDVAKFRLRAMSDEAATKLIYLALRNIAKRWKMPPIARRAARTQFAILFGERFAAAA
jgi:putative transposase